MKVLLVYQEIPEEVKFYVLDLEAQEDFQVLEAANGYFIGQVNLPEEADAALNKIGLALQGNPEFQKWYIEMGVPKEWAGRWSQCLVEAKDLPKVSGIHRVFTGGYFL